jgi:exosortase/archaeosortase family protein
MADSSAGADMTWIGRNDHVVPTRNSDRSLLSFPLKFLWAVQKSMSRAQFFSGLFILALVNGLAARVIESSINLNFFEGTAAALLGVSAVVWFACFAAVSLVLGSTDKDELKPADLLFGSVVLLLVAVPIKELSWLALGAQAIYVLGVSRAGSTMSRAALIFVAITVPMCWGPLVLHAFAQPFLWTDAVFVSNLIGTERIGNVVGFAHGAGTFQIFPACSSFHNMSLAFLAWMATSQFVEHKPSPKDILWCLLAGFSVFGVNVIRLALIGLYREHFETIHGSFGSTVADLVSLSLIVGVCLLGVRREIFARG